jgi:hypothetical protein
VCEKRKAGKVVAQKPGKRTELNDTNVPFKVFMGISMSRARDPLPYWRAGDREYEAKLVA